MPFINSTNLATKEPGIAAVRDADPTGVLEYAQLDGAGCVRLTA